MKMITYSDSLGNHSEAVCLLSESSQMDGLPDCIYIGRVGDEDPSIIYSRRGDAYVRYRLYSSDGQVSEIPEDVLHKFHQYFNSIFAFNLKNQS